MLLGDDMKKNNKNYSQDFEMGNLVKIIIVLSIVFGLFYILTYYIQKNKKTESNNNDTKNTITTIQYDEILMGEILNQSESEYYVLMVKKEDYTKTYKEYISKYSNGNKFYYSLLDNGMNSRYLSESSNLNVENIDELKVVGTSMVKVNSGKIIESYDGSSSVMQAFIKMNS